MANATLTTPVAANEDPRKGTYTPTLIASLFARFLGALAVHIEAERDIQDVDVWDAALSGWLRVDLHRFCSGQVLMLGGPLFEGHGGFPAEG